jgi:DNA repair ATPase RecN
LLFSNISDKTYGNEMLKFSRRTKIVLAFIAVVAIGYAIVWYTQANGGVPVSFIDARTQGAIIAQNIVNLSNQSTDQLEQIDQLDQKGDYADALTLTTNLVSESQQIRTQAVDLSTQVGNMTQALSGINNFDAQQAALESISNRLALINELITYSGDLSNLLDTLQSRFSGTGGTNAKVQGLVNQINTDVNAINNFNSQAGQAMDRFDAIVNK